MSERAYDLVEQRNDAAGFAIGVPVGWEVLTGSRLGADLLALQPGRGQEYRSSLVVTVEQLDADATLHSWQDAARTALPALLDDFFLVDEHVVAQRDSDSGPVLERIACHVTDAGGFGPTAVTMNQWAMTNDRRGLTLTATSLTADWHAASSLFDVVAATFRALPASRS